MTLAKSDAVKLIFSALDSTDDVEDDVKKSKDEATILMGQKSAIDSLGFLSFVSQLEEQISKHQGVEVSLLADVDIDATSSPFRTVGSLAAHLVDVLKAGSR